MPRRSVDVPRPTPSTPRSSPASPRPLPDAQTALLSEFVTRRRQVVAMLVAERQRERRVSDRRLARSLARLIKALERELATLDQAIDEQVCACPAWREKQDLLACVP